MTQPMRVGIDSYSYHRRYGETRLGESPVPGSVWPREPSPVMAHARSLGVDDLLLETCYLPSPATLDAALIDRDECLEVAFSWGHPWPDGAFHGLEGGRSAAAEDDLATWIALAGDLGHRVMRITLGSPATRGDEPAVDLIPRLLEPVRRAADLAATVDLSLAIENHGDLTAVELVDLIERAGRPNLGITLDNVNLIRLGEDMLEGTRIAAPLTRLVQLKDHRPTDDPAVPGGPVCTTLGEGVAPLDGVIDVLAQAGYSGPVCVELASLGGGRPDELAMIERSVAWLREHVSPTLPTA